MSRQKVQWTPWEDAKLKEFVRLHGENWAEIASLMKTRDSHQVRSRYLNKIICSNNRPFTEDENNFIQYLYNQHGPKWSQIARQLKERTENQVKNHFYSKLQKNKKVCIQSDLPDQVVQNVVEDNKQVVRPIYGDGNRKVVMYKEIPIQGPDKYKEVGCQVNFDSEYSHLQLLNLLKQLQDKVDKTNGLSPEQITKQEYA